MQLTLDQLLERLASGALTPQGAAGELQRIAREYPAQCAELIRSVQREALSGRLDQSSAQNLLSAIEQLVPGLSETAQHADKTERAAKTVSHHETLVRAAQTIDQTLAFDAPADHTLASGTQVSSLTQAEATHRMSDAARTQARSPQSQAHTELLQPALASSNAANTQVIRERLVRSLEDVDQPTNQTLRPGSIIKQRFILETLIGKGGMGLVFSAIDRRKQEAQDPNPRIALKVLNADVERHPQSFIALQREARKAQTLAHPNVVTVFDFDRDDHTVYMTMELLQGRSLEAIVRESRGTGISPALALPIVRGIAEGLAYAHRKGIVHSDLKPGNVFIVEDGTPKILDFGIARAVPNANSAEMPDIFDAGSLGAYTEAYATDEMIDGIDPHPADDLYALGIIAYELLTGLHPYQRYGAPTARKLGIKPPPLKGLRQREAKALERCLSFDRKQRPQDAGEFLKLFRGVSAVQRVAVAVAAVLALTAGYFGYQEYVETSPATPFSQLPAQTQQDFMSAMAEGDLAWRFYIEEKNPVALNDALEFYSIAYAAHPRNRTAVKALRRSADAYLELHGNDAAERRKAAAFLQGKSDYFLKYPPAVQAAR